MQCRFPFFEKRLVLCLLFSFKGVKNEFVFSLNPPEKLGRIFVSQILCCCNFVQIVLHHADTDDAETKNT